MKKMPFEEGHPITLNFSFIEANTTLKKKIEAP